MAAHNVAIGWRTVSTQLSREPRPAEWEPDTPEVGEVGEGPIHWAHVAAYVRDHLPALRGEFSVERFVRGGLHDAYLVRYGQTKLALRTFATPPTRQAEVHAALAAVARSFDRAPAPLLLCDDPSVAGVPFEVLQYQPGFVITDRLPNAFVHEPEVGRRLAAAVVEALAQLHAVDGGPTHGSFSLARCQFDADPEGGSPDRVTGVLGWDHISLAGDASADVSNLVATWPGPTLGLPPAQELADMYADATAAVAN